MTSKPRSIRINLRFGPRTDPALIQDLAQLDPRERAQWVRAWVIDGWRHRFERLPNRAQKPEGLLSGTVAPPSFVVTPTPPAPTERRAPSRATTAMESVLALLGERIR